MQAANEIVERIREMKSGNPVDNGEYIETKYELPPEVAAAMIGQYAYQYSEDIRKDRDEWKALALHFVNSVNDKESSHD